MEYIRKAIFYIFTAASMLMLSTVRLHAQEVRAGIGTDDPKSVLDVTSFTQGLLIPRMTAPEVEAIQNPDESELVYSLSGDGTVVNRTGFWFFQSGTWLPLIKDAATLENIYNMDGTLESDRVVYQDGKFLNIGPDLLYVDGGSAAVGVGTNSPTRTLDVNGNVLVQGLDTVGNVVSNADGVLTHETEFFEYGDVKPSYLLQDHDGWYMLDGRHIDSLPATARANALSILGGVTNIPDARGKYSMGTTSTPGSTLGTNTVTLTRANLPNVNFSYSSSQAAAHSHTYTYAFTRITAAHGGGNNIHVYWLGGAFSAGANYTRTTNSNFHNHTFSANTGGSAAPIDISPRAINFNYFVYLGE